MCLELFYQQIGEKDVNLTINQVKEDLIPEQLYSNTLEMQANEGQVHINPIDPSPAVAAHAVLSGHSHLEKWQLFHIFPHFSRGEPKKLHIGVQYIKLKAIKCSSKYQRNHFENRYS